jgi:radical SAM protein (TIGR01212 family)
LVGEIDSLVGETPPLTLAGRLNSITAQVERGKKFIARRYGPCALSIYFQAFTNTYDSLENLKLLYDRALSDGPYKELIVSTRPDMVEDGVLRLLASYRSQVEEVCLELGLQSGNDKSLQFINRGHTVEEFLDACQRAKREGLQITTHLILGLPNEGEAEILESAKVVRESSSDALKIHHLQIGAGTPMALLYERGEVQAPTFEEHLENTILLLRHIPPTTVIQRLVSETPRHRLVAPRDFGDKAQFLATLKREMEQRGVRQGDAL